MNKIKDRSLKRSAPSFSFVKILMLSSMFITVSQSLQGAIVNVNTGFEDNATLLPFPSISTAPLTSWNPQGVTVPDPNPPFGPITVSSVEGIDPTSPYGIAAHSGSIASVFSSDPSAPINSMATISQQVNTTLGQSYNIQLWVANPFQDLSARANLFSVMWGSTLVNLATIDPVHFAIQTGAPGELVGASSAYIVKPASPWFVVDLSNLLATSSQTVLTISGQNNNFVTLVDDVLVTETPEPSTVALLGMGAALMGVRRRRPARS